jgi:anthranilate/para-aminobenzoate synthase component I
VSEQLFRAEIPEWVEPERLHAYLAAQSTSSVWLDAGPQATSGFSYLAVVSDVLTNDDALRELGAHLPTPHRVDSNDTHSGPFALGWVGWFGYEYGVRLVGRSSEASRYPDVALARVRAAFAFNHALRRCFMLADSQQGIAELARLKEASELWIPTSHPTPKPVISWRHEADDYESMVDACKRAIRDGDAFQLCLTNEISASGDFDARTVYERLRHDNPSHHGALLRLAGVSLLSSSPEVFLRVTADGRAITMPIKGTRRRGRDQSEDENLAAELRASAKEQAENLMIVDLMRNDLSRVAVTGTVAAHDLLQVHSLPHVHQLVSTVSAQVRPELTALDVIEAAFPAGSMTGAPKIAAIGILAELERGPRGIYSGAFGWLGRDGTCELAMVIRSIIIDDAGATIGTGGGITSDSDSAFELEETRIKAAAALRALGA